MNIYIREVSGNEKKKTKKTAASEQHTLQEDDDFDKEGEEEVKGAGHGKAAAAAASSNKAQYSGGLVLDPKIGKLKFQRTFSSDNQNFWISIVCLHYLFMSFFLSTYSKWSLPSAYNFLQFSTYYFKVCIPFKNDLKSYSPSYFQVCTRRWSFYLISTRFTLASSKNTTSASLQFTIQRLVLSLMIEWYCFFTGFRWSASSARWWSAWGRPAEGNQTACGKEKRGQKAPQDWAQWRQEETGTEHFSRKKKALINIMAKQFYCS